MRIYINESIAPLPGEDGLIDRMALLGHDEHQRPHSWIGVCNARCELRFIVESFSPGQDTQVGDLLRQTGLLCQTESTFGPEELFVDEIGSLDRVFMVMH
jgi:hypothetical protein